MWLYSRRWKKCNKWLLKTGSRLGCCSQQPLPTCKLTLLKVLFFPSLSLLLLSLLHRSFRSSFPISSTTLPAEGDPQSSGLGSLLLLLFCPFLSWGSGRDGLHVCTPTSDLLQNKVVVCLSRKGGLHMSENDALSLQKKCHGYVHFSEWQRSCTLRCC